MGRAGHLVSILCAVLLDFAIGTSASSAWRKREPPSRPFVIALGVYAFEVGGALAVGVADQRLGNSPRP